MNFFFHSTAPTMAAISQYCRGMLDAGEPPPPCTTPLPKFTEKPDPSEPKVLIRSPVLALDELAKLKLSGGNVMGRLVVLDGCAVVLETCPQSLGAFSPAIYLLSTSTAAITAPIKSILLLMSGAFCAAAVL